MILILTSKLCTLTNTQLQVRVTCSAYPMFCDVSSWLLGLSLGAVACYKFVLTDYDSLGLGLVKLCRRCITENENCVEFPNKTRHEECVQVVSAYLTIIHNYLLNLKKFSNFIIRKTIYIQIITLVRVINIKSTVERKTENYLRQL